ncbi:MAG: DUF222 domain-containing protein [bacterium]|nr:DUF222 domain-containing protein [bacterium]
MFDHERWAGGGPQQEAVEPPALHPADAEDELVAILGRIDRLEAQAAAVLAEVNDATRWRRRGYTSATAFLKHCAGYTAGRAMRLVARSNSLAEMPLTADAFACGELSADQVDVLAGAYNFAAEAYLEEEATLVDLAIQLPFVDELSRLIEYWKQRIDPESVELDQDMINSLRGIKVRRDRGVGRTYVCFNDEETDMLLRAIEPGPPVPEDTRTLPQRRADRLIEIIAGAMDRPQLLIHVNADEALAGHQTHTAQVPNPPRVHGETEFGTVLTPGALSRIACDAEVCRIVFGPDSQILDVGRKQRLFTEPQRRAIIARDRHCRFPGCDRSPRWADVHHLKHWLHGGKTEVDNGILLCRFHHTLVHEAGWTLSGTPTHLIFLDDLGRRYGATRAGPMLARAP